MNKPDSLAANLFLLAFDLRKERLISRQELGYFLRAACLAELLMTGHLVDKSGKAMVGTPPVGLLPAPTAVWEKIAEAPPRSWRRWISADRKLAFDLARDELAAAGVIKVEHRRLLGLFPSTRITPRQPYVARRLQEQVDRAIRGGQPVTRIDPTIRTLAALAGAGELRAVLSWTERRRYKARLTQLAEPIEPITTALRRAIAAQRQAVSGAGATTIVAGC